MNRKEYVACNFTCVDKTEGFPKITSSHMHGRSYYKLLIDDLWPAE